MNAIDPFGLEVPIDGGPWTPDNKGSKTVYTKCGKWRCAISNPFWLYPKLCVRVCTCYDEDCEGRRSNVRQCYDYKLDYGPFAPSPPQPPPIA